MAPSNEHPAGGWLFGLNPEQREAVLHDLGPMLVLAGAGSGKTTVLVARAGRLVDEGVVRSEELAVLTFTNKAARELKHRVAAKLGTRAEGIFAGTFHSFGLQILRQFYREARLPAQFGIVDAADAGSIVKELLLDFRHGDKTKYDANRLLSLLSQWRERGQRQAEKDDEYEAAVERVLPLYERRLEQLGIVDFDGLLLKPLELLDDSKVGERIRRRFRQVMVDEFQDTNVLQMRLLNRLVADHKNLSVVGDDDQSIYGWRGACVANILDFPKFYDGCRVVRLERNYRSTPAILKLANAIIAKNEKRHGKILRAEGKDEEGHVPELFVYENESEEAESVAAEIHRLIDDGVPKADIAALYRSNTQGAMLEAELRRLAVPYAISGGTGFFDRKEVRDALAYLRSAIRPHDIAFRRVLNTPPRGIGEKTYATLETYALARRLRFFQAVAEWRAAGIDERTGAAVEQFLRDLSDLRIALVRPSPEDAKEPPSKRLLRWLERIHYRDFQEKLAGDALVAAKRWRVIEIFAGILDKFLQVDRDPEKSLQEFLEAMELRDEGDDDRHEKVQLLTLHACKGLEFPHVFLMGVEEDLLPHKRLGNDVTEERRLFYVGVTRARERLYLTRCKVRKKHGRPAPAVPSRFLTEQPEGLWKEYEGSRPTTPETRKQMLAALFRKIDSLGP